MNEIIYSYIDTKLGTMIAGATDRGLCLLEFNDPLRTAKTLAKITNNYHFVFVEGSDPILKQTEKELDLYFKGLLKVFTIPIDMIGTDFEKNVWTQLLKIPLGKTKSYLEIAKEIGKPTAFRAVAKANGANNISIIIPCHRVIASNGKLQGYGGGLWRKEKLLNLEKFKDLNYSNKFKPEKLANWINN